MTYTSNKYAPLCCLQLSATTTASNYQHLDNLKLNKPKWAAGGTPRIPKAQKVSYPWPSYYFCLDWLAHLNQPKDNPMKWYYKEGVVDNIDIYSAHYKLTKSIL